MIHLSLLKVCLMNSHPPPHTVDFTDSSSSVPYTPLPDDTTNAHPMHETQTHQPQLIAPLSWLSQTAFWFSRLGYYAQTQEALHISAFAMQLVFTHQPCHQLPIIAASLLDYDTCDVNSQAHSVGFYLSTVIALFATAFTYPVFYQKTPEQSWLLHPACGWLVQASRVGIALGAFSLKNDVSYALPLAVLLLAIPGTSLTVSYERIASSVMQWVDERENQSASQDLQKILPTRWSQAIVWAFIAMNSISAALSFQRLLETNWPSTVPPQLNWLCAVFIAAGNVPYMMQLTTFARAGYQTRLQYQLNTMETNNDLPAAIQKEVFDHPEAFCAAAYAFRMCLFTILAIDVMNTLNIKSSSAGGIALVTTNALLSGAYTHVTAGCLARELSYAMCRLNSAPDSVKKKAIDPNEQNAWIMA